AISAGTGRPSDLYNSRTRPYSLLIAPIGTMVISCAAIALLGAPALAGSLADRDSKIFDQIPISLCLYDGCAGKCALQACKSAISKISNGSATTSHLLSISCRQMIVSCFLE